MTISGLLERIDDWINPIVVKELRQAVKSRIVVGILMLFLGLQLFLVGSYLLIREVRGESNAVDWNAGNEVFRIQQGILLWTLMIFVPAYAAIRLGSERSDHNVDLLFISTLHPRSIIWGKFFAALVLALLVYSTCAPFMTFTYLLRGIDIPTILTVLFIDLLAMLFSTMLALFLAAVPGGRVVKFFCCFVGFVALCVLCSFLTGITVELITMGVGFWAELRDFGAVLIVTVSGLLALIGLLFCYAVALISPPSSNRILPLRVYFFTVWLAMGVALFLTSYYFRPATHLGPVIVWVVFSSLLISVQFIISIGERDRWGPRVARAIPSNLLVRSFAFLFYTGAAGGLALTVLMQIATFVAAWLWCENFIGSRGEEACRAVIQAFALVALYVFCYGLSAVLVRNYLFAGQLKTSFTWLVTMLLAGLGSSVPSVVAFLFFREQMRYDTDGGWWKLPSPFMALSEILPWGPFSSRNETFETMCFWFLGTWAILVSVLCLPWFVGQLRQFAPPAAREPALAPVTVVESPEPIRAGSSPAPEAARPAALHIESIQAQ